MPLRRQRHQLYRKLKNGLEFPIACKELAKKYLNEEIEDEWRPSRRKRRSKGAGGPAHSTQLCAELLRRMYAEGKSAANKAREAVCKRWGKDAIGTFGIGYAPVEGFIAWAKQKAWT